MHWTASRSAKAEPVQLARQILGREIDLQDAPALLPPGSLGRMQDRGAIQPNIPGVSEAGDAPTLRDDGRDSCILKSTDEMRSRRNQQGSVIRRNAIQMDSRGQHSLDHIERRLDMGRPGFAIPIGEAGRFYPTLCGNRSILMPGQRPIRLGGLVEQDRTNRLGCSTELFRRQSSHRAVHQARGQFWTAVNPLTRASHRRENREQLVKVVGTQNLGEVLSAVPVEFKRHWLNRCCGARSLRRPR